MPTTDAPWGLLVIPSDDLRGMLDVDTVRGGPGLMYEWQCPVCRVRWWQSPGYGMDRCENHVRQGASRSGCRTAVRLRWEGQDLPHGWLAAGRALNSRLLWDMSGSVHKSNRSHLIAALQAAGCTIIAVDEHGREVEHG